MNYARTLEALLEAQADSVAYRVLRRLEPIEAFAPERSQVKASPLPRRLRHGLEQVFGAPFIRVRIHTDARAHRWCRRLKARAFTVGYDVFFAPGQYAPHTRVGLHLLAHELTHVVQQTWFKRCHAGSNSLAPVLQCRIIYSGENEPKPKKVLKEVKTYLKQVRYPLDRKGGVAAEKTRQALTNKKDSELVQDITDGLQRLRDAVEDYGLIDTKDAQQFRYLLTALCDQMVRPESHPTAEEYTPPRVEGETFDLALVGRGASIGYYLNSLPPTYDHGNTLVIGEEDPWSGENPDGRGKGYINHQRQMIGYYRDKVPGFSEAYFDREEFAKATRKEIELAEIGTSVIGSVSSIKYDKKLKTFAIAGPQGKTFYARKVVIGMGAGPHFVPPKVKGIRAEEDKAETRTIMDLDEFMRFSFDYRQTDLLKKKKIIVHGPNAGIDAVERAGECGMDITWLVGKTPPVILKPNHLRHAADLAKQAISVEREGFSFIKTDGKLKVTCRLFSDNKPRIFENIDYYVYALGQDINAEGATGAILDKNISRNLAPLYDINQRLGDNPYETVLALEYRPPKTDDIRLQIIGAGAYSMARAYAVKHSPVAANFTRDLIEKLCGKLRKANADLGRRAENFYKQRVAKPNWKKMLRDRQYLHDDDYKAIAEWVLEQNVVRGRYICDRASKKPVDSDAYRELLEKIQPFDSWLRQVNLLAHIAANTDVQKEMDNQTKTLPSSVIVAPQLSSIRTAMMALNASMPRFITSSVDLVGNDRTELQMYLMTRIVSRNAGDGLSSELAAVLVEELVTQRGKLEAFPYGLDTRRHMRVLDPLPTAAPRRRWF